MWCLVYEFTTFTQKIKICFSNSDVKTSRDTSNVGRGRGRGDRSNKSDARGRGGATTGRGGKNSSLVQTSGLFSEGTGETKLRKSQSGKKLSR